MTPRYRPNSSEVFDRESSNSYSAEPQLDVNYYQNDVGPFDTHLYGQVAHFVNSNNNMPEATRVHFEPTINLPLSNGWGSLNTEAKLLATHYQQSNLDKYNAANGTDYKESVSRVMPQFKVDGKMVFERDLQEDSPKRWNRACSICTCRTAIRVKSATTTPRCCSRITPVCSATVPIAVWTASRRLIRSPPGSPRACMMPPRWNVLIFPLVKSTISPSHAPVMTTSTGEQRYLGSLVWAGDTYWRIADEWGLRGGIQYDTRLDNVATGNGTIEYRRDENRLVQLNYRYASPEYIQATLPSYSTAAQYKQGISQVGMTASWPIVDRWSVVGAYYYDTNTRKAANQMLGVQYNSCCYAIRLGYERKVNGWNSNDNGGEQIR